MNRAKPSRTSWDPTSLLTLAEDPTGVQTTEAAPHWAQDMLLAGVVFFVLALVAVHMAGAPNAITNVWFANAAAMALLASARPRRWPGLLLALALANLLANVLLRGNWLLSASFVPGNLVEVVVGAVLLNRMRLARRFDNSPLELSLTLVVAGLVPQLLGATIGAAVLEAYGFATFRGAWLGWYADSTLGAVALLPLALALRRHQMERTPVHLWAPAPLLFWLLGLVVLFAAFRYWPAPFEVAALPLVASVFFLRLTATYALCFAMVLMVCAGLDYGLLRWDDAAPNWTKLMLHLPAAAAVVPTLYLAVVMARMRRLQTDTDALTLVGNDSVAVLDRHGVFRGVNRAFEQRFGRDRSALLGQAIGQHSADGAAFAGLDWQSFQQAWVGHQVLLRAHTPTAQGLRVLDLQYQPVPQEDGRTGRVLVSGHDVTELVASQRELEAVVRQLRTANEGLQQFVRMASHDLREPLNTIAQFSNLVGTEHAHELSPAARQYFHLIGTGARRMRSLLDDVLTFARLEEGAEVAQKVVALDDVFDVVLAALGARLAECQAQVDRQPQLPAVLGNESLLVLLFQNLVSNGVKFVRAGVAPEVRISAVQEGPWVHVTVADKGIGIAAAEQSSLFQPFKRLHTRRQYDGTGLGLVISSRVARAMGGGVELKSEPGVGTELRVTLRAAAAAPEA